VNADPDLRYEVKFVCDAHWLPQARSWIRLHPAGFVVTYPPRRVNSLYLDTPHLSGLDDNLQGNAWRQKLRLRWYGDEMADIQPVLELKQKRNLLGRKKRYPLPVRLDLALPWAEIMRVVRANAAPEWQMILQTMNQPVLLNHYQREYYATPDGAIRVTLDFAQAAYEQRLSLRPNLRVRLPVADTVVVEVKAGQDQAEQLPDIVARLPVLRTRHSKYVSSLLMAMA